MWPLSAWLVPEIDQLFIVGLRYVCVEGEGGARIHQTRVFLREREHLVGAVGGGLLRLMVVAGTGQKGSISIRQS